MKVIGKADKYYTLWDVTEETIHIDENKSYKKIKCQYLQNLAMDRDVAMKKVPGAEVDEGLRGHSSFERIEYPKPPEDTFQGGKYEGKKVIECTDYNYMGWAWNNAQYLLGSVKAMVEGILIDAGWRHLYKDESFQSPETVAEFEARYRKIEELAEKVSNADELVFEIGFNPNEDGDVYVEGGDIALHFDRLIEYNYQGWPYWLPMDKQGKAKRIKNKKVKIVPKDVEIDREGFGLRNSIKVYVDSFEILK